MLDALIPSPPDKILALIAAYNADPRTDKLDLGVGVYRDSTGHTAIMNAVKTAEARLLEAQDTKTYLGLAGDVGFNDAMTRLVLGPVLDTGRTAALQTPGGSGALRLLAELVRRAKDDAVVWLSDPTWPNHAPILDQVGLKQRSYPYFDRETRAVDFNAMVDGLKAAGPGDVVLLHGCCHNPTGANLTPDQWDVIADMAAAQGFLPFVDLAYQGFGDGLEEDAVGVRALAAKVPEMLIASSCSKNFAVYRDRVGCAIALSANGAQSDAARSNMFALGRVNHSMPPDHGAAVVRMILQDDALRADWLAELTTMRERMLSLRETLARTLRDKSGSDRHGFLAQHRGMFSLLGATPEQVTRLRDEHGIYMTADSRMNIAGLREDKMEWFADALLGVGV